MTAPARTTVHGIPVRTVHAATVRRLIELLGAPTSRYGAFLLWHGVRVGVSADAETGQIATRLRVDGAERQYAETPDDAYALVMATGGLR